MLISELKQKKKKLESDLRKGILDLMRDFKEDTECDINNVFFDFHIPTDLTGTSSLYLTKVVVTIVI